MSAYNWTVAGQTVTGTEDLKWLLTRTCMSVTRVTTNVEQRKTTRKVTGMGHFTLTVTMTVRTE